MNRDNLVLAKQAFNTDFNAFDLGKVYRCLPNDKEFMVMAETFSAKEFKNKFTFFLDTVKEEWEALGLIKNGKKISKAAFKELASINSYGSGREKLHVFFFYMNPKTIMYGFYPTFRDTKASSLNSAYINYTNIIDGHTEGLDRQYSEAPLVQRGNSGIPIRYRSIYWK